MPDVSKLIRAAKNADWRQVVMNGGPPCFHRHPDDDQFCLRTQRWDGHPSFHRFVPLDDLLLSMAMPAPLATRMSAALEFGIMCTAGSEAQLRLQRARVEFEDWCNSDGKPIYRLLTEDDLIQRDDEVLSDDAVNWFPVLGIFHGRRWNSKLMPLRRRVPR